MTTVTPSPNFSERKGVLAPDMIVLHYTGMADAASALARLTTAGTEVSAHYVVMEDGNIIQCVRESQRAWHAGTSSWDGDSDVNSASIGIEIVNPGHDLGFCFQYCSDQKLNTQLGSCVRCDCILRVTLERLSCKT